jgi:hypothetical protein
MVSDRLLIDRLEGTRQNPEPIILEQGFVGSWQQLQWDATFL